MKLAFACASFALLVAACSADATTSSPSTSGDTSPTGPATPSSSGGNGAQGAGSNGADAGSSRVDASAAGSPSSGDDAGSPAHDDAGADSGAPSTAIDYAPYFPTWVWGGSGYAIRGLADLATKSGLKEVTIAFVLSGGGCKADQGIEQNLDDVKAFEAMGGHVKASFGGADGTYIDSECTDASSWATAIEDFVDATGITDLDFDIEQDPVLTDAVNATRGQALKLAQDARHVQVAFTLAANPHTSDAPGGLTSQGLSVVTHAAQAGVIISHVNLMTMDYGDSYGGQPLAPVAIGSLTDANAQLVGALSGLTPTAAWRMLGVIPMIGKNDDAEVFSLDDAQTLAAFAKKESLGLVSFWSIDRDQVCPQGGDYNSCSTVNTSDFDFDHALGAVVP